MTLMAVLGAALVLLICVGLTWSARSGAGGTSTRARDGARGEQPQPEWWSEFERQFRAYAQADGDRPATPRDRGPRSV